jgi:hypothetical protein
MRVEAVRKGSHYEVLVDGKFYCSADTLTEAAEEIERLRLENREIETRKLRDLGTLRKLGVFIFLCFWTNLWTKIFDRFCPGHFVNFWLDKFVDKRTLSAHFFRRICPQKT